MAQQLIAASQQNGQQKTFRQLYTDSVLSSTDNHLGLVLTKIASYLSENGVQATAADLAKVLEMPAPAPAPVAAAPGFGAFPGLSAQSLPLPAPSLGGSFSLGSQPIPAGKGKKAAASDVDFGAANFDDKFNPDGCLYVPSRGTLRFKFCGAARDGGYPVCSSCKEKKGGKDLIDRLYKEQNHFNIDAIRQENQNKRLTAAAKEPNNKGQGLGAPLGLPNFAIGGNPLLQQQRLGAPSGISIGGGALPSPGGLGFAQPAPTQSQLHARRYKGSPTETDFVWLKDYSFVAWMIPNDPNGKLKIIGFADTPDTPYRKLTQQEYASASSSALFVCDPSIIGLSLTSPQQPGLGSPSSSLFAPQQPGLGSPSSSLFAPQQPGLGSPSSSLFAPQQPGLPSPMGFTSPAPQPLGSSFATAPATAPQPFGLASPQAPQAPQALQAPQPFGLASPQAPQALQALQSPQPFGLASPQAPQPFGNGQSIGLASPQALQAPQPFGNGQSFGLASPQTQQAPQPFGNGQSFGLASPQTQQAQQAPQPFGVATSYPSPTPQALQAPQPFGVAAPQTFQPQYDTQVTAPATSEIVNVAVPPASTPLTMPVDMSQQPQQLQIQEMAQPQVQLSAPQPLTQMAQPQVQLSAPQPEVAIFN
jgi:hypothetical protein